MSAKNPAVKSINYLLPSLLVWSCMASAAPPLPSAGSLMPSAISDVPPAPASSLNIERANATQGVPTAPQDGRKLTVQGLNVVGASVFPPAVLVQASGFVAGQAYTLLELQTLAHRMERYYQDRGYSVAQAYLPAQDVSSGEVTIRINLAEGRYGQVLVRNQSHASAGLLSDMLQDIQSGNLVQAEALDTSLLLLSDLPGVQIKSALVPGATFGTSDLLVDVLPTRRVTGSVDADNAGNYYTGAVRVGASIFLNEPSGEGDLASLRLQTTGVGLNYVRAAYQLQIAQARVGVAFSDMEYTLGQEFESLQANGLARTFGVFTSYPWVRSRNANLVASASFDSKRFEDRLDAVASVTEKSAHVLAASLSGELHEHWGEGGTSALTLTLSRGDLNIQTAAARAVDATTVQSNGSFSKLSYLASHVQNLSPSLQLAATLNGQWASKNLDASEKMELGGMSAVRAYPEGEAYGDEGYVVSLEARWLLPTWMQASQGAVQGFVFADTGSVTFNKSPWTADPNQRHLSSTGLGLQWSAPQKFLVRVIYAHKLGDEASRSAPDANDQLWLQAIRYF